jgi:predicted ATPase
MRRIVLTGGPGAGKTVISRALAERFPDRLVVVPESATQIYARWHRRRDQLTHPERREVQRQIYALQLRQEAELAAAAGHPHQILLLDRGTLDGACYWPDGVDDYWQHMNTTRDAELARYDAVIWLESCAALGLYDGNASNVCRWEDAPAAIEAGNLVKRVWGGHPRLYTVPAYPDLKEKMEHVATQIVELLSGGAESGLQPRRGVRM